jgi:hypothetical protein
MKAQSTNQENPMVGAAGIAGYVLTGMTLLLAYIQWKKSVQLQEILAEAVARNETLQAQSMGMRAKVAEAEEAFEKRGKSSARLEKSLDEWKAKAESFERRIGDEQQTYELNFERERGQVERFKEEMKALMVQLVEADQDRKELRKTLESRKTIAVERNEKEYTQLKEQVSDLSARYAKVQSEARRMESILKKIDPKETARIKRKNKQYSQLFIIMRGQKELAEELSQNWELGLRQTAAWIIKTQNPGTVIPTGIGPLVGTALELIGGHLYDDSTPDSNSNMDAQAETEQELDDLISKAEFAARNAQSVLKEDQISLPLAAANDRGADLA